MEYRRFGDTLVVRLDPGEEIVEQLLAVAAQEKIHLAEINGLGAVREFTAGVFRLAEKQFQGNEFRGEFEIVSLTGTLTEQDGKPYAHLHMSAGDREGRVFGGHLSRAVISATGEVVVRVLDGCVGRRFDQEIGLNLFDFQ